MTYAPGEAPPPPCRLSSRERRGNACQAACVSVPYLSYYFSPGLPIPVRFQTHRGRQKRRLPHISRVYDSRVDFGDLNLGECHLVIVWVLGILQLI